MSFYGSYCLTRVCRNDKIIIAALKESGNNFIAADVMELADMQDLGSCAARRAGSSPVIRIKPRNEDSGIFCGWRP